MSLCVCLCNYIVYVWSLPIWGQKKRVGFSPCMQHCLNWNIFQLLFDRLPWNSVQTFMVSRGWILIMLSIPRLFRCCNHEVHRREFDWNISTTVLWVDMKFGRHIPVPLRMNCNNFGEPYSCATRLKTAHLTALHLNKWQSCQHQLHLVFSADQQMECYAKYTHFYTKISVYIHVLLMH